eukprot:12883324-Ditylum_brightwellii.AAC.1
MMKSFRSVKMLDIIIVQICCLTFRTYNQWNGGLNPKELQPELVTFGRDKQIHSLPELEKNMM